MIGLFRPKRLGKVFSYSNQYIETSFFLFLIPLKSYFIDLNTKETIEIPLNKTSLKNYYTPLALVAAGILFFVGMIGLGPTFSEKDGNSYLAYLPAIGSGLIILFGLVLSFKIGKSGQKEIKKRTIFQSTLDINALPEWLSVTTANEILQKNKTRLPENWKKKIVDEKLTSDDFFLYYTILSYETRVNAIKENSDLLNRLEQKLK